MSIYGYIRVSSKDQNEDRQLIALHINEIQYNAAVSLMKEKKYDDAISAFEKLNGYKDSNKKISAIYTQQEINKLKAATVGNTVTFGNYHNDINWTVLEKSETEMFVLSDAILDYVPYYTDDNSVSSLTTWKDCTLRQWLNKSFLNQAFSEEEQTKIMDIIVSADKNPETNADPGDETKDKIFLLSIDEYERYKEKLPDKVNSSYYDNTHILFFPNNYELNFCWWLRSPGEKPTYSNLSPYAACVEYDGDIWYHGEHTHSKYGVRPAMWINISDVEG